MAKFLKKLGKILKKIAPIILAIALPALGAFAAVGMLGAGASALATTAAGALGGAIGGLGASAIGAKIQGQPWNLRQGLPAAAGGAILGGYGGYSGWFSPTQTVGNYASLAPQNITTGQLVNTSGLGLNPAGSGLGLNAASGGLGLNAAPYFAAAGAAGLPAGAVGNAFTTPVLSNLEASYGGANALPTSPLIDAAGNAVPFYDPSQPAAVPNTAKTAQLQAPGPDKLTQPATTPNPYESLANQQVYDATGGGFNVAADSAQPQTGLGLKPPTSTPSAQLQATASTVDAPAGAAKPGVFDRMWGGVKDAVSGLPEAAGKALPTMGSQMLSGMLTPQPELDPSIQAALDAASLGAQQDIEFARRGNQYALDAQGRFTDRASQYNSEDWFRQRAAEEQAGASARRSQQRNELARQLRAQGKDEASIAATLAPFDTDTALVGQNAYRQTYNNLRDTGMGYEGAAAGLRWPGASGSATSLAGTAGNLQSQLYNQFTTERAANANLWSQPFEQQAKDANERKRLEDEARRKAEAERITNI